ncbi:hypothetical protein R1flu_008550 [Riccia fluitans]|uniref:Uncharacterized protein n=1 Tax=Riccia fluitans TaxID=41844 RepID=A0ABD1YCN8_9MARC
MVLLKKGIHLISARGIPGGILLRGVPPLNVPKALLASLIYRRFRADPPYCGSAPDSFFLSRVGASPSKLWGMGNTSFALILRVVDPHRTTNFSSLRVMRSLSELLGIGVRDIGPSGLWIRRREWLFSPTLELFEASPSYGARMLKGSQLSCFSFGVGGPRWTASGCTLRSGTSNQDPWRAWDGFVYPKCAGTKVATARAVFLLRASRFCRISGRGGSAMGPFV